MTATLELLLDLGDLFTKGVATQQGRRKRLRFPSVVAHRLLEAGDQESDLLLDRNLELTRLDERHARPHSRTRSYPGAAEALASATPVRGARFAGWLAARIGAERRLLGVEPSAEIVDALVRKALLQLARGGFACERVRLVLVVDVGAKADVLASYAGAHERLALSSHTLRRREARRIEVELACEIADAPSCAAAALPEEIARAGDLLLIDVGYLRSKLAVLTAAGCALQTELSGLGVADCVRRLLRDEQEQGLLEDELAVALALERSQTVIEVAQRRFEIAHTLDSARRAVATELSAAAKRVAMEHYRACGSPCKALALVGGGAALIGHEIAERLAGAEVGLDRTWLAPDPSFMLLHGAERMRALQR